MPRLPSAFTETNDLASSPIERRLSSSAATRGDPSPSLSTPRPDERRGFGVSTIDGVDRPVFASRLKTLRGVADLGVWPACFNSSLNSFFGDAERNVIFFCRGVFPGVVGLAGLGVICLDGVVGFLIGVPAFEVAALGVVDFLALTLRRPEVRGICVARLGLPVDDVTVARWAGIADLGGEPGSGCSWKGELASSPMSASTSIIAFACDLFVSGCGGRMPPIA